MVIGQAVGIKHIKQISITSVIRHEYAMQADSGDGQQPSQAIPRFEHHNTIGKLNGFYKSIRPCLRNGHWYQKLVLSRPGVTPYTTIRFGKLRPTSHWCFLSPDESMVPVLAITDMVARSRRRDSIL
jgi:hypothetical protein